MGARAVQFSRRDLQVGNEAWAGAEAAYLIAPNMHPDEPGLIASFLDLVRAAGVQRVVYHSVVAPHSATMRHHMGKARSEDLVRTSDLEWTILQPGVYMQNFLPAADASEIRVPFSVDVSFGMVDLADVGEAAAIVCLDRAHHGATYELGGPELVSIRQAALTAGDLLGRVITPVEETRAQWVSRARSHLTSEAVEMSSDMWSYYDRHGLPTGPRPLAGLLRRPAHSFADALRTWLGHKSAQ